jgi:hypothetical protein
LHFLQVTDADLSGDMMDSLPVRSNETGDMGMRDPADIVRTAVFIAYGLRSMAPVSQGVCVVGSRLSVMVRLFRLRHIFPLSFTLGLS